MKITFTGEYIKFSVVELSTDLFEVLSKIKMQEGLTFQEVLLKKKTFKKLGIKSIDDFPKVMTVEGLFDLNAEFKIDITSDSKPAISIKSNRLNNQSSSLNKLNYGGVSTNSLIKKKKDKHYFYVEETSRGRFSKEMDNVLINELSFLRCNISNGGNSIAKKFFHIINLHDKNGIVPLDTEFSRNKQYKIAII
jgi:hypothetical protein